MEIFPENFCENVLQHHPIPVFFLDTNGFVVWMNELSEKLFQLKEHTSFLHHLNSEPVNFYFNEALKGQANIFQIEMERNQTIKVSICFTPIMEHGQMIGVYGVASNDAKRNLIEEKAVKLAYEDYLTQLPNRFQFIHKLQEKITQARKKQTKLAVLIFDVNRFRMINETLGYYFGDQALKAITKRICKFLKSQDIIARMGGDEFILLLDEVYSVTDVKEFVQQLLNDMNEPYEIEGFELTITTSVGVSIFPDHGLDTQTLIKTADTALSKAKGNGTNHFEIYQSEMANGTYEWFEVEKYLHKALERDEFELYYQPQFDANSHEICGIEVLVRWRHPEHGLVSPATFIEIAEETGLIAPIGQWVLLQSCIQMKSWLDQGHPHVPLSVNVSLKQFMQKNFTQVVANVLEQSNLPPEYLILEVTESVTIDLERAIKVMEELNKLGVKISLDDFGTGYSSLQYLSELPIAEMKIDKSFVDGIEKNDRSKAIIAMIVKLGHLLNVSVIAEGVENRNQYLYLKEQGCDKIQGYFFSKPLITSDYEKLYVNC